MFEGAAYATERARDFVSGTTTVLSKARSMVSGDALFFSVAPKIDDLRFELAADSLYDKRDAMKKIIAQMCKGVDMHALFPDVVKNIHAPSTELRKLIYLFVVHYAEDCPNEALLSISAFQKDLVDPSMHVRSLALRMLSSIQIPAIHPVVMVAVRKSASDTAMIVRKTAAIALWQMRCVSQRGTDMNSVCEILRELLNDKAPDVVGAAVASFERICKHRLDLLHPVYRHLCTTLPSCEEWGQDAILRVLLRYARDQFCDPVKPTDASSSAASSSSEGDEDASSDDSSGSSSSSDSDSSLYRRQRNQGRRNNLSDEAPLDPDHLLLLTAAKPLLFSLSSSVVVGVCALYMHCAPPRYLDYCVKPLIRVLRSAKEGHGIILNTINCLLAKRSETFTPYIKEFYILPQDSADVRALKHRILARLATKDNLSDLFQEYKAYVRGVNEEAVAEAIRGMGFIVARHPTFSAMTMRLLTPLLSRSSPAIVTEAVAVLRLLVMQGKDGQQSVRLVFKLMQEAVDEKITTPSAVATVLWLVGESLRLHPAMAAAAPDCFRVFVQRFSSLERDVKMETLTLGCKIWLRLDGETELAQRFRDLFLFALELARYDDDYQVRDQARLIECTCDRESETFRAIKASLEEEKPLPFAADPYAERANYELGTFSNYFGVPMFHYKDLPEWRSEPSDPTLRRPARSVGMDNGVAFDGGVGARSSNTSRKKQATLWSSSSSSSLASSASSGSGTSSDETSGTESFYSSGTDRSSDSGADESEDDANSESSSSAASAAMGAGEEAPKPSFNHKAIRITVKQLAEQNDSDG